MVTAELIDSQKWDEIRAAKERQQEGAEAEAVRVIVALVFDNMDILVRFARQVVMAQLPPNALYKYRNEYLLIVDFSDTPEGDVKRLSSLTDEYARDIYVGAERAAHIEEHGEVILKERALEQLRQL